jgi:hypothetical protein
MSGPNAFSMRRAISGVSLALPCEEKIREGRSPNIQDLGRLRDVQAEGFDDFRSDQVARMGRASSWASWSPNGSRSGRQRWPYSSPRFAPERMQLPSRKSADLLDIVGGFQGQQKLARLRRQLACHPFNRTCPNRVHFVCPRPSLGTTRVRLERIFGKTEIGRQGEAHTPAAGAGLETLRRRGRPPHKM